MKSFKNHHFPFDTYNSLLLKPIQEVTFPLKRSSGRVVSIKVKKHEFIDLNKNTGEFYVRNKFTGTNVLLSGDDYNHKFDTNCLKNFLKNIESNFLVIMDGRDSKTK